VLAVENVGELADSCLGIDSKCTEVQEVDNRKDGDERAADEFVLQEKNSGTDQDGPGKDREGDFLDDLKPVLGQPLLSYTDESEENIPKNENDYQQTNIALKRENLAKITGRKVSAQEIGCQE